MAGRLRSFSWTPPTNQFLRYKRYWDVDGLRFGIPSWRERQDLAEILLHPSALETHGLSAAGIRASQLVLLDRAAFHLFQLESIVGRPRAGSDKAPRVSLSASVEGQRHLLGITVHPLHRGEGHGRVGMKAGIQLLRGQGHEVWVGTATTNHAMQAIMAGLGYRPTEERDHQLPNGTITPSIWYRCS